MSNEVIVISGIQMQLAKKIFVSLSKVFGIGQYSAQKICLDLGINPNMKFKDATIEDINAIRAKIELSFVVEGDLRKKIQSNIEQKKSINCYQGVRHRLRLPVHGQRTKTNARTRKGKRSTVANKKINKK